MFCAISGQIPTEPVVSRQSGLLFEKRLIEKALIATGGKCPQTGDDLSSDDLIPVKTSGKHARPTVSSATSFPAILESLQADWDALMLETHALRKAVSKTKQELAHALYQQDAANRVIAKLIQEKKELQEELLAGQPPQGASLKRAHPASNGARKPPLPPPKSDAAGAVADTASAPASDETATGEPETKRRRDAPAEEEAPAPAAGGEEVAMEDAAFSSELLTAIEAEADSLKTKRKARKTSKSLAKPSAVAAYSSVAQSTPTASSPATSLLALDGRRVLAGFANGRACILDGATLGELSAVDLQHGDGGVTSLVGLGEGAFASSGRDGVVRMWGADAPSAARAERGLGRPVEDLAGHPHGGLLLAVGGGRWEWLDAEAGRLAGGKGVDALVSCAVHPDGLLFAVGDAKGGVQMFDVRTMQPLLRLDGGWQAGGHGATSIAMSENGYCVAAGVDERVAIWDLRKQRVVKEVGVEGIGPVAVALDYSGVFGAAVAARGHAVFATKKKAGVVATCGYEEKGEKGSRQGVLWMPEAEALLTGHADGTVHRYSRPADAV